MRHLMNEVIHSILDPDMACYWRTRPRFLILDQPGQFAYTFALTLLYHLSPVVAGLLICTWWITSQWHTTLTFLLLIGISASLYFLAEATNLCQLTRKEDLALISWMRLYQLLVDRRTDQEFRTLIRSVIDRNQKLTNGAYAYITPHLAKHLNTQEMSKHSHVALSYLVEPRLACLSELGYSIEINHRITRTPSPRRRAQTWESELAPVA